MNPELQTSDTEKHPQYALIGAFLMAALVFLIIPLTQTRISQPSKKVDVRKIVMIEPPVPVEPPDTVEYSTTRESALKPSFQKQLPAPDLAQLKLSLNPGVGEALAIGLADSGFTLETDAVGEIEKLFTFSDLPEAPRIINYPRIQFPRELVRRGITEGRVVVLIEIDEQGRAEVIRIESSTHSLLNKEAEKVVRQAQFTKPLIDGVARRVRGKLPINLREPK